MGQGAEPPVNPPCLRHANLKGRRPGGLRGTESPVQEAGGITGGTAPCVKKVLEHANTYLFHFDLASVSYSSSFP
jgi:hypothetical protein